MKAQARRAVRRDDGFTLAELTVTVGLVSVLGLMVLLGMVAFMRATSTASGKLESLGQARLVMSSTTRLLRTATPIDAGSAAFDVAGSYEVTFYANVDTVSAPVRVHLFLDNGPGCEPPAAPCRLVRDMTPPDSTTPPFTYSAAPQRRIVAGYLVNQTTGAPLFRYYDGVGGAIAAPITGSDLLGIRSVGIEVSTRRSSDENQSPTSLVSRVLLPNALGPSPTP